MVSEYLTFIFWFHLLFNVFVLVSPFLVPWWIILLLVLALEVQYAIIGGCIVSAVEFGNSNDFFFGVYTDKLGLHLNHVYLKFFIRYVAPFVILAFAIFWQKYLHKRPLSSVFIDSIKKKFKKK